jgi:hypothetical protein
MIARRDRREERKGVEVDAGCGLLRPANSEVGPSSPARLPRVPMMKAYVTYIGPAQTWVEVLDVRLRCGWR